ncbi:L-fuculose 1-phosphate aldolase [Nitrospirillum amazonense]|uniref:L-fuculose 1-phosphate aldolase n=1 Tax=Nitrospirillum amazonense TaxID=28077 RepID=A0A560JW61_9PROT|nr:class II aldolase/adducin family protein [Nitrospirillum amazonense]TWB75353.1 L-fuculose 1-phosphate aldolase [Nitrospirillum amazonense]
MGTTLPPEDDQALRQAVIATAQAMNTLGINQGKSGNVSARCDGGFLVTPSGVPYEALTPDAIVFMDLQGRYRGTMVPSSEWRMHLAIYQERPQAGAVVHTHSTFCTALACLREPIPAFHYMVAVAGGTRIEVADYATFGTAALSDAMMAALGSRRACLLANHGMIAFGADLRRALDLAVEVESLARQYWHARMMGTPVILDDEEMAEVLRRFATYGRQPKDLPPGTPQALEFPEKLP